MYNGFSREELATDGRLTPHDHNGYPVGYIWADTSHPTWQGCAASTIKYLARLHHQGQDISPVPLYRSVKEPNGVERPYYHILAFKHRYEAKRLKNGTTSVICTFDPMLCKEKHKQQTTRSRGLRSSNRLIQRFYTMGDRNALIRCPLEYINIDTQKRRGKTIHNLADQHHIVCWFGESVQKGGIDPGKLNSRTDLFQPGERSRLVIEDMMRTIFLSRTGHHLVHHWEHSDVNSYDIHELPWALRDIWNYNEFTGWLEQLGYDPFPAYDEWMDTLTLEYHGLNPQPEQYMRPESTINTDGMP